jgi:hypothetical protein
MVVDILLALIGIAIAAVTLRDVFDTVIVPGTSHTTLHVARRLVLLLLPIWKRIRGRRRALSGNFAPIVLVSSFIIWMTLLMLGFAMVAYALRSLFAPPLSSFGEAIYVVGSAIATIGEGEAVPHGLARGVVVASGLCGLAVMTMAVTYLLEVQDSIGRRDTGIMKLNTSAGEPPSALALLERYAAIHNQGEIGDILREARDWCATVRQSHSAHPSLIYFRTQRTGAGWPAALGALLDLALIAERCLADESLYGPGVLLRDDGVRVSTELAAMIRLPPRPLDTRETDLRELVERLSKAGYALRGDIDFAAFAEQRAQAQNSVTAMAEHLGQPAAVLIRR